jgi:urea transport system permease protein
VDALSGVSVGAVPAEALELVRINNPLRRALAVAIARLSLRLPDRQARLAAARELALPPALVMLEALEAALAVESDAVVQAELEYALAINAVAAPAGSVAPWRLIEAVGVLGARGGREALAMLDRLPPNDDPALAAAAERARAHRGAAPRARGAADRSLRAPPRLRAASGRGRPRGDLRRHGRHQ